MSRKKSRLLTVLRWLGLILLALWSFAALTLVSMRWIDPPTTAVQTQRRVQSWF